MSKKLLFNENTPHTEYGSDMVFEVFVENTGKTVNLPVDSYSGTSYYLLDCTVDWGDGTSNTYKGSRPSHKYSTTGSYIVRCSGSIPALNSYRMVSSKSDWTKLNVLSWGNTGLRSLFNMSRCLYIQKVAPLTTGNMELLTDVSQMFTTDSLGDTGAVITSIPDDMFRNAKNITKFDRCFANCLNLTGKTPTDEDGGELWERKGKTGYPTSITGTKCFYECRGLSNFSDIPNEWVN
jgi:hypothetical protein